MDSAFAAAATSMALSPEPSLFEAGRQPDSITATGPTVVTTLERLNAPAAKIVYTPITENEIRLVTICAGSSRDLIRCYLATASEDQMPSYEALSYDCRSCTQSQCTVPLSLVPRG
jgi:hypothetical protein